MPFFSASMVERPGPRAFSFESMRMKPPSSGGWNAASKASKAIASRPRPMMNAADRTALPAPTVWKKLRRDTDMRASLPTVAGRSLQYTAEAAARGGFFAGSGVARRAAGGAPGR